MPESGGPTTQTGTFFQNTVAAWYLARMLHENLNKQTDNLIIRVRCEAPESVDDVVVTFERGIHYVQVKNTLQASGQVWIKLWQHLWSQFNRIDPQHVRLVIWGGTYTKVFRDLQEIVKRAQTTQSGARRQQLSEFISRLTKTQLAWLNNITEIIREHETERVLSSDSIEITQGDVFEILQVIDVIVKGNAKEIQDQAVNTFLNGMADASMIFTILRDFAAQSASNRGTWNRESLYTALTAQGVKLDPPGRTDTFLTKQEGLEQELKTRQNNWYSLRQQAALYGAAFVPLQLQNQIEQEEKEIQNLERQLAKLKQDLAT